MLVALPGCAAATADSKAGHPGATGGYAAEFAVAAARSAAPVIIAPEVVHGFSFLYEHIDRTEFVLCLEGTVNKGRVYVPGFQLAVLRKTTIGSVSYQPCSNRNYVGTAHNHPPGATTAVLCAQSQPDRITFANDERAVVDIVLCGNTRYLWVMKDGRNAVDDGSASLKRLLAESRR